MKGKIIFGSIVFAIVAILLTACVANKNKITKKVINDTVEEESSNEIVVWSHFALDARIDKFIEKHPDIKVIEKIIPYNNGAYVNEYLDGLLSDEVPDVMVIDSNDYGNFNTIDGLEDLNNDEYDFKKYIPGFDKELLEVGKTLDGSKQIGIPYATSPIVTYYRADIMEENGFPSDPEELATFMENPDNYVEMAKALKKKDIYINTWPTDTMKPYNSSLGYFDRNLNYLKDTEECIKSIEISKIMRDDYLVTYNDIWKPEGVEDLRNNKLAMVFLGSWGADQLKAWVPEQTGKWRVTRLPFNLYGWNNSTILSMPEKGKNKENAWKLIEFLAFKDDKSALMAAVSAYIPNRKDNELMEHTNQFLNNQKDKAFYEVIMEKTEEYQPTPLDKEAQEIWYTTMNTELEEGLPANVIAENIKANIDEKLQKQKEIILESRR